MVHHPVVCCTFFESDALSAASAELRSNISAVCDVLTVAAFGAVDASTFLEFIRESCATVDALVSAIGDE